MKARATDPGGFIPYRENELTKLMQDVLGGNAKTLMFVNASPSTYNMPETFLSLVYVSRRQPLSLSVCLSVFRSFVRSFARSLAHPPIYIYLPVPRRYASTAREIKNDVKVTSDSSKVTAMVERIR